MQEMTMNFSRDLRIFYNESQTHLGYNNYGNFAYLCDECSYLLSKTVIRYYFQKKEYAVPPAQSILWRYMDFAKYVSLLSRNSLYFASASSFEDIFEGAKGNITRKEIWDNHYYAFMVSAIRNPPNGYSFNKTNEEVSAEATKLLNELNSIGDYDRKCTFINCWHENSFESEAMWKLYSKDISNAIAIQTTYGSLYNSLDKNPDIAIGRVNYVDFSRNFAPINGSCWYKRKSFEHEKEVRAITIDRDQKNQNGLFIPININKLIENVYVSPSAPEWFTELVIDISKAYNLNASVLHSSLLEKPFY